jgi:hypothetical protein
MTDAPQQPPSGQPPSEPGNPRRIWTAFAIGLGALVLAVILFILLRPDDSDETSATTDTTPTVQTTTTVETTTEATTEVQTTTEQTTTTEPADEAVRVRIRVENAQPVGGVQDHEVDEGDEVLLIVTSDVADEVHLHGYDLPAAVAPGQPARIRFDANLVGEFEIELEERGVPIGNLVVS